MATVKSMLATGQARRVYCSSGGLRFSPDALSGEAVKGNLTTTVIPGVDES
ncbi:MAG TPA: hypothetical protein VFE96_09795 [Candidatus Bathyarchaeia archaeon]|nr:hypothetical protein [Candidatus Bathyarchaeia archaeon]